MSTTKNTIIRVILITLTLIILFFLLSCRKDKIDPKESQCQESEFSGNWRFISNPNQANADTVYLDLDWVGNAYTINSIAATRGVINSYWVQYNNGSHTVLIDTKNCKITYNGFEGEKQ